MNRSKRKPISAQAINVPAMLVGGKVVLVDSAGKALCRPLPHDQLAKGISALAIEKWIWAQALRLEVLRFQVATSMKRRQRDPWMMKMDSLAKAFHLRSRDEARPKSRRRFEHYSTATWEDAVKRLWHQGNNRLRNFARSGWERWSITVANNHNKRKGGRYGKTQDRHVDNALANDSAAVIPVRA